jgi:acetoacetyl-CoA synthetase
MSRDKAIWGPFLSGQTQMEKFITFINRRFELSIDNYQQLHQWSVTHIADFWQSVASFTHIQFDVEPEVWFEPGETMRAAKWLKGARLNYAKNILRNSHSGLAVIAYSETGMPHTIHFDQLQKQVAACAAFLREHDIKVGDRVVAICKNEIQSIVAMLACSSVGAVWASCSPEFGEYAIIERFQQIEPKLLFAVNFHQYNGNIYEHENKIRQIVDEVSSLQHVIWLDKPGNTHVEDHFWEDFIHLEQPLIFASLPADHPLFILFSSGTTGKPKCIVHRAGGVLLEHAKALNLHTNLTENERMLFFTTCGWMMWNWMLSSLMFGTTLVLYDGNPAYPSNSRLLDVLEETQTTVLGASAAYFLSLQKSQLTISIEKLSKLHTILSTGSTLVAHQYEYLVQLIGRPIQISSISGGTDIVSCFALGNPIVPVFIGELQSIGLGMDVQVFNEHGVSVNEAQGELVCCKPFPTLPLGFWGDTEQQERYKNAYFMKYGENIWAHGDFAATTPHHGLIIFGRSDSTLNPHGVRFGTAELYRVLDEIREIEEEIAVSQNWANDTRVILFVKMQAGVELTNVLKHHISALIRSRLSPRHVPAKILQVSDIPKTWNGKIMESAVRKIVQGETIENMSIIVNPECLEDYWNRIELMAD